MDNPRFQRQVEDFTCENCGCFVKGTGFTNHCPDCLWSKHVDVNPGDRSEQCMGMMKPVGIELKNGDYFIVHQCVKCGFERRNKITDDDNFDVITELSSDAIKKLT